VDLHTAHVIVNGNSGRTKSRGMGNLGKDDLCIEWSVGHDNGRRCSGAAASAWSL
jgi:hypothetical protein